MAKIKSHSTIDLEITLSLNEKEAKFLSLLFSYAEEDILKVLSQVSENFRRGDELIGFRLLKHENTRGILDAELGKLKSAREIFNKK